MNINEKPIRSFIAIDIPNDIRQTINKLIVQLKLHLPTQPIRWVSAENIHLTIRFLGDISYGHLSFLLPNLQQVINKIPEITVTVTGMGAYPNKNRARVLWVGSETSPELTPYINNINDILCNLGLPKEERKFTPHLTIGRIKNVSLLNYSIIESVLTDINVGILGNFHVKSINIYKSDLTPYGAVYSSLYSLPLNG